MKCICDTIHDHEKQVWNVLEKNNLCCYQNTYLKTHVLLIADVFENFRNMCLKYYKFNLASFHTAFELAWQALLKIACEYYETEVKLKDCELCLILR